MKLFYVFALWLALAGCAGTYRDFPVDALSQKPKPGSCKVMYYNVERFNILDMGGYSKLQHMFRNTAMCEKMVSADSDPGKGLYVEVETKWKPMTIPALVFGYMSISTLTVLPAWSTKDGYLVKYDVHVDGKKVETYNYEITRKAGIWIGLLPFAWINFLTYDEADAFEATANQFVNDARLYLTNPEL